MDSHLVRIANSHLDLVYMSMHKERLFLHRGRGRASECLLLLRGLDMEGVIL